MPTPWSKVNEVFFELVEEDSGFFHYYNATDEESYALAVERANSLLRAAAARMMRSCNCEIDFTDTYVDEESEEIYFSADLTEEEINLLANLQYEGYLKRDMSKLKAFRHGFTPSDLQVFSPANDRKTFIEMYNTVCEENKTALDDYKRRDRLTNAPKGIDYLSFDEEG